MPFSGILSAVAGPVISGIMGNRSAKKARKNAIEDARQQYVRLRESAELGGFNPLTAIQTGGVGGFQNLPSGAAPLASTAILTGAVQGLADVLTSKKETKMTEQQVRDDLMKISTEQSNPGGFGSVVKTSRSAQIPMAPGAGQMAPPVQQDPSQFTIPWVMDTIRGPFKAGERPAVETDMAEDINRQHVGPTRQSFTRPDGSVISIPVGPDPEEIAAGVMMEQGDTIWEYVKDQWQGGKSMQPLRLGVSALSGIYKADRALQDIVRGKHGEWPSTKANMKKQEDRWKNRPAASDLKNIPYLKGF